MSVSISTGLVPSASLVPRCWDESHLFCKLWLLFLLRLLLLLSLLRLTSDPKLLRRHLFTSLPSNASLVQVQSSYHGGMNGRGPEKFGNFVFCLNSSWPSYFELLSIVRNASQSVAVFVRLTLRFLLIYLFFRQQERRT